MSKPLYISLDNTLIFTNALHESWLILLKKNFLLFLKIIFIYFTQGKVTALKLTADNINLSDHSFPYNKALINFLQAKKNEGRKIFLLTKVDRKSAEEITDRLALFDDIIPQTKNNEAECYHLMKSEKSKKLSILGFLKGIRVHHYVKNLLIFVPLILSHQFTNPTLIFYNLLAFISFCLLASSVYILNDLLDLDADRKHTRKSTRPFASGQLSISAGTLLATLFFLTSITIACFLTPKFQVTLAAYYLLTLLYSLYFKRMILLDVWVLASLYTIRVIAGMTLINLSYSAWLISFCIFIFLSLALAKRYLELERKSKEGQLKAHGRNYHIDQRPFISTLGLCFGTISILVLALYLNTSIAKASYSNPLFLWGIPVLTSYWIARLWLLTTNGELHEDPIVFALKDKTSHLIIVLMIILFTLASYL